MDKHRGGFPPTPIFGLETPIFGPLGSTYWSFGFNGVPMYAVKLSASMEDIETVHQYLGQVFLKRWFHQQHLEINRYTLEIFQMDTVPKLMVWTTYLVQCLIQPIIFESQLRHVGLVIVLPAKASTGMYVCIYTHSHIVWCKFIRMYIYIYTIIFVPRPGSNFYLYAFFECGNPIANSLKQMPILFVKQERLPHPPSCINQTYKHNGAWCMVHGHGFSAAICMCACSRFHDNNSLLSRT